MITGRIISFCQALFHLFYIFFIEVIITVRGANKRIIEINSLESETFDKAIFFVKNSRSSDDEKDLKNNAYIYLYDICKLTRGRSRRSSFLLSFFKFISSALVGATVAFFIIK